MINSRFLLATVFLLSIALLQEGCETTSVANANPRAAITLVDGFSGNGLYYGFVGMGPTSAAGFFKKGAVAARAFLIGPNGKVLLWPRIHNLGTIRRIPRTRQLVYFSPRRVCLLKPRSGQGVSPARKWLFIPEPERLILADGSHCALSSNGRFAAFVVADLAGGDTAAQDVYLVRILDDRILVLPTHRLVMGVAFRRDRLLVNTGGQSHRLWVVDFNPIDSHAGMTILRRTTVPGRLVAVSGGQPVFESHTSRSLFIGNRKVSFQGAQIRDVACGRAGVLAVLAGGRVMWWRAGKVRAILRVVPSQIAGMGANSRGLWVAERNGRLLLVNAEGSGRWTKLVYPEMGK